MSDMVKEMAAKRAAALEAKKRADEAAKAADEAAEEAARAVAEMEADMAEMARIASKYGLSGSQATASAKAPAKAEQPRPGLLVKRKPVNGAALGNPNSMTARSRIESAKVIRELGRPVPTGELHAKIAARGVKIGGKNPSWALSATLGRTPGFESVPDRGWWLRELGTPPEPVRRVLPNGAASARLNG